MYPCMVIFTDMCNLRFQEMNNLESPLEYGLMDESTDSKVILLATGSVQAGHGLWPYSCSTQDSGAVWWNLEECRVGEEAQQVQGR